MNDKTARDKLRKIEEQRKLDGVGRYRNSRREKNNSRKELNDLLNEIKSNNR